MVQSLVEELAQLCRELFDDFMAADDSDKVLMIVYFSSAATIFYQLVVFLAGYKRMQEVHKQQQIANRSKRKSIVAAYVLLIFTGVFGAHHYYLENRRRGLLYTLTFGLLGLGPIYDSFTLRSQVLRINAVRKLEGGVDMTFCQSLSAVIGFWLPAMFLLYFGVGCMVVVFAPTFLDLLGVVDLFALRAGLSSNPYSVLRVPSGSSFTEAKVSYRKLSLEFHPDKHPNCADCSAKMAELNVALTAVKELDGSLFRRPTAQGIETLFDGLEDDWLAIIRIGHEKYQILREKCGNYCSFLDTPKKRKKKANKVRRDDL